jgi:uncharacterized membrane protein YczE
MAFEVSMKLPSFQRILLVIAGIMLMGFGIALMRFAAWGTDPYTCLNLGVSSKLGISLGTWQLLLNGVILVAIIFADRKKIGFGTIFNMVATGYSADFFLLLITLLPAVPPGFTIAAQVIALTMGIIIMCFGVALYIEGNLGIAPYDAIAMIISEKIKHPHWFRWVRIVTDLLSVLIGFMFGSVVGVGTVLMAFFAGPLIVFFRARIAPASKDS